MHVHGQAGRKKPLIEMREHLDEQHRRFGDSLVAVNRLLDEATVVLSTGRRSV